MARVSTAAIASRSRSRFARRQRLPERAGCSCASKQRLVGVDVADAGDDASGRAGSPSGCGRVRATALAPVRRRRGRTAPGPGRDLSKHASSSSRRRRTGRRCRTGGGRGSAARVPSSRSKTRCGVRLRAARRPATTVNCPVIPRWTTQPAARRRSMRIHLPRRRRPATVRPDEPPGPVGRPRRGAALVAGLRTPRDACGRPAAAAGRGRRFRLRAVRASASSSECDERMIQ